MPRLSTVYETNLSGSLSIVPDSQQKPPRFGNRFCLLHQVDRIRYTQLKHFRFQPDFCIKIPHCLKTILIKPLRVRLWVSFHTDSLPLSFATTRYWSVSRAATSEYRRRLLLHQLSVMIPTIAKDWKLHVRLCACTSKAPRHYAAARNTVSWQPVRSPVLPPFRGNINLQLAEEEQGKTGSYSLSRQQRSRLQRQGEGGNPITLLSKGRGKISTS